MENIKIALCDDEELTLKNEFEHINDVLEKLDVEYSIDEFVDPKELLNSPFKYDMVFLDIEMGETNGINVARKIIENNSDCFIFFITNYSVYLDDAFDVRAFRFLQKPIDKKRLSSGISAAIERIADRNRVIKLTNNKNKISLDIELSSVLYIECANRHTHVVTKDLDFIADELYKNVKAAIEKEGLSYFAQPHQSFLVNLRFVTYYDRFSVGLSYGDKTYKADMSRRQYNSFDTKFFLHAKG